MASKTIPELTLAGSFNADSSFMVVDDGTQTFKVPVARVGGIKKVVSFNPLLTGDLGTPNQPYGVFTVPTDVNFVDVEVITRAPNPFAIGRGITGLLEESGNYTQWGGSPVLLNPSRRYKQSVVSAYSTSASTRFLLDDNNRIWSWGANNQGQGGDGTVVDKTVPTLIGQKQFAKLFPGFWATFALDVLGDLYFMGGNPVDGVGGIGITTSVSVPTLIANPGPLERFKEVKAGFATNLNATAIALTNFGNVYTWGANTNGQLGDGTIIPKSTPVKITTAEKIVQVAMSAAQRNDLNDGPTMFALSVTGKLYAWGKNQRGTIGDGTAVDKSTPTLVSGGHVFKKIFANDYNSVVVALKENGDAYLWGQNLYGSIGDGTIVHKSTPTLLTGKWKDFALNGTSVYGVRDTGALYAWGNNTGGQLGDGTIIAKSTPTLIAGGATGWEVFMEGNPVNIDLMMASREGRIWAWGFQASTGVLGDGTIVSKSTPTLVIQQPAPRLSPVVKTKRIAVTPGATIKVFLEPFFARFGDTILNGERADEMNIYFETRT